MSITLYIHSVESNAQLDLQVYPSIHKIYKYFRWLLDIVQSSYELSCGTNITSP